MNPEKKLAAPDAYYILGPIYVTNIRETIWCFMVLSSNTVSLQGEKIKYEYTEKPSSY